MALPRQSGRWASWLWREPRATVPADYLIAGGCVLIAYGATSLLAPYAGGGVSPVFYAAITAASWYGGLGPGLFATMLSAMGLNAIEDAMPGPAGASETTRLLVFASVAVVTSVLHALVRRKEWSLRRVQDELEARAVQRSEELARANARLQEQIAERERAEQTLREKEERFRELFEDAPIAYHEIDSEGIIRRVNRAECELLGYQASELLGRAVWEFVAPEHRPLSRSEVRMKLAGARDIAPFVRSYIKRDGGRIWFEIHERPIRSRAGEITGMRSALLDITLRLEAEDAIRRLNAELEMRVEERTAELRRSNEDLQQFAYVASHDLQEPLRMIASYTGLLGRKYKGKLDHDADEYIQYAVDGALRMSELITGLLAFSRAGDPNRGRVGLVDTREVLADVLRNLHLSIQESRAEITTGVLPAVMADRSRMVQLLQNLISNAVKYRGETGLHIDVGAEERDGEWVFRVSDNGIGFDSHQAERIFGVFKRLHGRSYPGTGIGLAICKRIVEYHGGRIWAESQPGCGSRFYFTLPAAKANQAVPVSA
ncbi:MAG: PAS domain S-box protein [Acidobacteria bacterium]|nr:PAS domain S-box protein [Acidobacteriota bacterium]MBI3282303.1 PAS domain S-box protein [Acidobacteriota bacterium]